MKFIFRVIFIVLIFTSLCYKQAKSNPEVYVYNYSYNDDLRIVIYPVGAIFNGFKQYSLKCKFPTVDYSYIIGGTKELPKRVGTDAPRLFGLNLDIDATTSQTEASVGYGKYRIDFYKKNSSNVYELINVCYIDYSDFDLGTDYTLNSDIDIHYLTATDIRYWRYSEPILNQINAIPDSTIKIWDQRLHNPYGYKTQNKDGFISDTTGNSLWTQYPINASDLGGIHLYPNQFFVGLKIHNNGMSVQANKNIYFESSNLTMEENFSLIVGSSSNLIFDGYSKFRSLQSSGQKTITMGNNSYINVHDNRSINLNNTLFKPASSSS